MTGKRKIICSFVVLVLTTFLLWMDKINGDQYVEILNWLFFSFGLANGAEHISRGMQRER